VTDSVVLGPLIARGGTSEIYEWGAGRVLKLYREGFPLYGVERERDACRVAGRHALPVPEVGEIVETQGRFGLPFERVDAHTLASSMLAGSTTAEAAARLAAELHVAVHAIRPIGIESSTRFYSKFVEATSRLTPEEKNRVLSLMQSFPPGDRLCHGDFHAGNILMSERGAIIIDWGAASQGNQYADVAQTWVAMTEWLSFGLGEKRNSTLRGFIDTYVERYFELATDGREEFETWKPVVAAIRLAAPHPPSSDETLRRIIATAMPA
jgi:aminoglycoside phosphotransferase (APT) family kinase protein